MFMFKNFVSYEDSSQIENSTTRNYEYMYSCNEIIHQIEVIQDFLNVPTAQLSIAHFLDTEAIQQGYLRREEVSLIQLVYYLL